MASECLFGAWHRVGTDNDRDYYHTLLGAEKATQAIFSVPQDHQNAYCNSKLTKQPYDSFGRKYPE